MDRHNDETMFREYYEERAGILQYMGGYPKEKAEALARAETESYRRVREQAAMDAKVNK